MKFLDNYFKYEIGVEISGLTEQLNIFYLLKLYEKYDRNINRTNTRSNIF